MSNTPTLLELENKLQQAKNICYNNAVELHKIIELEKFCDELFWIAWDLMGNARENSNLVINEYLGTLNKEYQEIFKDDGCSIFGAFSVIKKNLYNKENPAPATYLKSYHSGNFVKCFELFDKF